ncbi:MAG: hypothetical protein L7V87_05745 [Verrucomicrobiales bacterium]|jgi:hypothetical protein|nr:hypothetical protein [Verrucomicrobiales bacterium]
MKHDTTRAGFPAHALVCTLIAAFGSLLLPSCTTTGNSGGSGAGHLPASALNHPAVKSRNAMIANEPAGDYYIGRRWWTDGTRFWGYLRKPRQPWSEARLVIMNESVMKQPDRVPEQSGPQSHGYDHNYEYRIWGSFTGLTIYDPNSNFRIPEFRLAKYEMISQNPGFLFWPGEQYGTRRLPPKHPATF